MFRFDIGAIDKLPTDNFKLIYETIFKFHDEVEEKMRKEGRFIYETILMFHEDAETAEVGAIVTALG